MNTPKTNTSTSPVLGENGFYYERRNLESEVSRAAEHAISMGSLASRMVLELRTRVEHPGGRPENVAEHAHMLSRLATGMYRRFRDVLPETMDEGMIGLYADIHDDVEAYVLDTATDFITEEGLRDKEAREVAGARQLYLEHKDIDPVYAERVKQYEAQEDPNARWVRLWDKDTTLLIHIPNRGKVIREHYESREIFLQAVYSHSDRLRRQFPEFAWALDIRDEHGVYLANLVYPSVA